jgi:hypothetical protein
MKKSATLTIGLMASTLIMSASGTGHADSATKTADQDFGRLSADGVSAFNDVHLARRAIFDGKTDEAAKFVADAQASLAKAKSDSAVFLKAETALRSSEKAAPRMSAAAGSEKPIAWVPIDSEIALGETFVSTPEKAAAVVTARKALEKGDNVKSLETIKQAQIDINFTLAVAPLDQSIAAIDQASSLIASHDYYGASQALRLAEAGVRYDEIDDIGNVKGRTTASNDKTK